MTDPGDPTDPTDPGTGDPDPRTDYSAYYDGTGLHPLDLPEGLSADAQVASAVAPGYIGFGTLMATLDLRMGLQAYEWFLPANAVSELPDAGTPEAPYPGRQQIACNQTGTAAFFHWIDTGASGFSTGDELTFGFGDCKPSSPQRFYSDGFEVTQPRVQRYEHQSADVHRFSLDSVKMAVHGHYAGLRLSGDRLVRTALPSGIAGSAAMTFSNVLDSGDVPAVFSISADTAAGPLALLVSEPGDGAASAPMRVRTELAVAGAPGVMRFVEAELPIELELADAESDREGSYSLTTAPEMIVDYAHAPILRSGGFTVAHAGSIYTYAVDADPAYLTVDIDNDSDGTIDVNGRISAALVVRRLDRMP